MAASSTSFKPGNLGGGRRAMTPEVRDALEEATPKAIAYLASVLNDNQSRTNDRIRAAEALLDRGLGKPTQAVDLEASGAMSMAVTIIDDIR